MKKKIEYSQSFEGIWMSWPFHRRGPIILFSLSLLIFEFLLNRELLQPLAAAKTMRTTCKHDWYFSPGQQLLRSRLYSHVVRLNNAGGWYLSRQKPS